MLATEPVVRVLTPLVTLPLPAAAVRRADAPELMARYGGALEIPLKGTRPTLVANFVSTLDGVVSYNTPEAAGGGEISGYFEPDRFVMGLLRALADAVLIGAGTLRAAPEERWTPEFIHPESALAFESVRAELGLGSHPRTVVVTASGDVDLAHPGLSDPRVPALIVTTDRGAHQVRRHGVPRHVEVRSVGPTVGVSWLMNAVADGGADLVVCEGGPHLLGQLLEANSVDELFITVAPQIAGRSTDAPRLSLVEGQAWSVAEAPWARLVDLRSAGDHLFTRYRLNGDLDR